LIRLPQQAIDELKEIYLSEFGISLRDEEAEMQARDKLRLIAMARTSKNLHE